MMIFSQHVSETENLSRFMMSSKVLTCHNQLGALSEYHSDSVCTHGRTKTSWLSLMRGAELKHPVETNFHCQHLVHFILLLIVTAAAGLEDWFSVCCCILIVFMVEMFRCDQSIQSDVNDEHFLLQKINIQTEQLILSECYRLQNLCYNHVQLAEAERRLQTIRLNQTGWFNVKDIINPVFCWQCGGPPDSTALCVKKQFDFFIMTYYNPTCRKILKW